MTPARKAGRFLFKWRGYTPIPLLLALILLARPTWWSTITGGLVVVGGELLRVSSASFASSPNRIMPAGSGVLITGGPYSFTRHPLYLGSFLVGLGFCLAAWAWMPWMVFAFVAAFSLQYAFIVRLEEEILLEKFGARYREYLNQVPRWAVRFTPYRPRYPEHGDFIWGLKSERRTLQSIAIVTILLILRGFVFSSWLQ